MLIAKGYSLEDAAKYFKVSSRTLNRWLAKEGVKWSDLKPAEDDHDNDVMSNTKTTAPTHSHTQGDVVSPLSHTHSVSSGGDDSGMESRGAHGEEFDPFLLLPKSVQTLITLAPQLKDLPSWLGSRIMDKLESVESNIIPKWTRPPIHHPIQNEAIDEICYGSKHVVMIDGSKRRGKTSTVFTGFCECQYNNKGFKRWFLYGASETNARKILRGMKEDPLFVEYTSPLYNGWGSAMRLTTYNQGRIEVMASHSERQTSGTDADVIWIDESHSVLIQNPKTFAMAAMVLLANNNMKFIFTMNREGEAYEYFRNEMLQHYPEDDIAYYSFTEENCPHITKEADSRVRVLVNASAGEEYAAQYMDNQYVRVGNQYYPSSKIQKAFQPYECPNIEQFDIIACGIDWGDNHDTALVVMGFLGDVGYELETVFQQHPSATEILRIITRFIREYPGVIFIWETSPLGSFARNEITEKYPRQVFLNSGYSKLKQNYLDNLYVWLTDEDLHLKDGKLKRQLLYFCNDKKNDDGHDALCHLLYKAMAPRTSMKVSMTVVE